jgi:glycosyltransferase involved in cell wall biosynthesis
MKKPLLSIIVPNYNHSSYLKKRIDSILDQSFIDYEIIFLDDASTDNSVEILNTYKDNPKIAHFIVNSKNSGSPFKQWQKGLKLAKGEFVWIAESDDWCEPDFLATAMQHLKKENANIFFCASTFYIQKEKRFELAPDATTDYTQKGTDLLLNGLLKDNLLRNASAVVFKKKLIKKFPKKITNFKVAGDWVFWTYLCRQPDCIVTYSKKTMNFFRLHQDSAAAKGKIYNPSILEGIHIILEAKKSKDINNKRMLRPILNFWYESIHFGILKHINKYKVSTIFVLIFTALRIDLSFGFKILRSARFYYLK